MRPILLSSVLNKRRDKSTQRWPQLGPILPAVHRDNNQYGPVVITPRVATNEQFVGVPEELSDNDVTLDEGVPVLEVDLLLLLAIPGMFDAPQN
jgi:hypothetical protein